MIPEDWFIKKSTVTGQETFFPRKLICERIELIKKQKDDVSLEEISELLGTSVGALKASYHLAVKKIEEFLKDKD